MIFPGPHPCEPQYVDVDRGGINVDGQIVVITRIRCPHGKSITMRESAPVELPPPPTPGRPCGYSKCTARLPAASAIWRVYCSSVCRRRARQERQNTRELGRTVPCTVCRRPVSVGRNGLRTRHPECRDEAMKRYQAEYGKTYRKHRKIAVRCALDAR